MLLSLFYKFPFVLPLSVDNLNLTSFFPAFPFTKQGG